MTKQSSTTQKDWKIGGSLGQRSRQFIRTKRSRAPIRLIANIATKFLRAYHNEGFYEFDENGERFLISTYAQTKRNKAFCVWDVGANAGQWVTELIEIAPRAQVQSFEILPPIADKFEERMTGVENVTLHRQGLSDQSGSVEVSWNRECDEASSIDARRFGAPGGNLLAQECQVTTIDELIKGGLPAPHFLKIDTEGHDAAVLRGAETLLSGPDAPELIQFEYGDTWIPSRETLERCHEYLSGCGYSVGRLFPNHVEFKPYSYSDEHYRMGNMVASRSPELTAKLGG